MQYATYYRSVERVGERDRPYAMRSETGIPVYVLRGLRIPVAAAWPALKHYDYGVAKVRCGIGT